MTRKVGDHGCGAAPCGNEQAGLEVFSPSGSVSVSSTPAHGQHLDSKLWVTAVCPLRKSSLAQKPQPVQSVRQCHQQVSCGLVRGSGLQMHTWPCWHPSFRARIFAAFSAGLAFTHRAVCPELLVGSFSCVAKHVAFCNEVHVCQALTAPSCHRLERRRGPEASAPAPEGPS